MKHIFILLLTCTTILSSSILDMMNQYRDGLVHRPGCGWSRDEACVWWTGGGSMLDLTMAFREEALHEGIATKIVLGRVSLTEAQVKAWLPWKAGETDVEMDGFGGDGNGRLTEDGRYEFDMAWLRCLVHYAPDFGTIESETSGGMQWIDVFPALLGCAKSIGPGIFENLDEIENWRQEIEHGVQITISEGKETCMHYPLDKLLEKRKLLMAKWMNDSIDCEADYDVRSMPGYASQRILGIQPVRVHTVYGEYEELPPDYVSQIVVEIVRDEKIVCQLTVSQKDLKTMSLTWLTGRNGEELHWTKARNFADMKLLPKLSAGGRSMVGRGPFRWGEPVSVRFRKVTGNVLNEEVWDRSLCGEKVFYALSMGYGECETVNELSMGETLASCLRKQHDLVQQEVAWIYESNRTDMLHISKFVEGIRLFKENGTLAKYYHGAGELAGNCLTERKYDDGRRWVEKAAINEASSAFLQRTCPGETVQSPWVQVVEMVKSGMEVRVGKVEDLFGWSKQLGKNECVVYGDACWAGSDSGMMYVDEQNMAFQMAVVEKTGDEPLTPENSTDVDDLPDNVVRYVLLMLYGLDGKDGWLGRGLAGHLTAMGLFCKLSEIREECPKIDRFSLEHEVFQQNKASIELKVEGGDSWNIQILNSKGYEVRRYNGNVDNETVLWDGCDENGTDCEDGIYQFTATVTNSEFHVSRSISGIMDTVPPVVQFVAWQELNSEGGSKLCGEYLVEDEHLGVMTAQLREIVSGRLLEIQTLEDSHGKLSFDIQEDLDGVFEWIVYAEDMAENQSEVTTVLKSGAYCSGEAWSLHKPGKEELKADGVRAELSVPLEGTEIDTEVVRVMGTADAVGGVQYMLRLWDSDGHLLPCLAEEREAGWLLKYVQNAASDEHLAYKIPRRQVVVVEGLLGLMDVSGLSNGRYQLELVVIGNNGTSNSLRDIYLERRQVNGAFEFSEIDGKVVVGGMEIKVQRTYSSGELRDGEMGYGWTWSFSATGGEVDDERETILDVVGNTVSVRFGGSRDVTLTLPDGRRCTYRFSLEEGGGWSFCYYAKWTPPSNVKAMLRPVVSNKLMTLPGLDPYWEATGTECDWELFDFPGFVLRDVDGTEYEYIREPLGEAALIGEDGGSSLVECYGDLKLSCIRKKNGESWKLNERNILHVKSNTDTEEILQMERDAAGHVTKLSVHGGNDILYDYDDGGNLSRVVKVKNGGEVLFRQYEYANEAFPHHLTGVMDGRGVRLMALEYDEFGGYCGMRNADGASASAIRDALDQFELQTDSYGHETLFGFDDKGQMTLKIEADGGRTQFVYDDAGREIRRTDPLGRSVTQDYDSEGNLVCRKAAGGGVTRYSYNADGQCTRLVDAAGRVMEAEYDKSGHASKIVTPTGVVMKRRFSKEGLLEAELDENGEELALYEHDKEGRRTAVTDYAGGTRQEFSYDGHGKLSHLEQRRFNPETGDVETYGLFYERDDDGNVISTHDSLGNWMQIVRNGSGLVVEKRMSNGLHQRYRHDVADRCVEEVDVEQYKVTRVVYDIGGRLVAQSSPEPVIMVGGKVPETIVFSTAWMFSYDAVGRQIGKSQRTNVSIRLVKTAEDCYCCEIMDDGEVLREEQTEHDLAGQVTREVSPLGYETRYLYDSNGNCTAVIDHYGNAQRRELDNLGNVVLQVDGLGHETKMEYDDIGRLSKTKFPDTSEWITVHDKEGNPIVRTDGEGRTTTIEYAFGNRPSKVALPECNGVIPTYLYGYDSNGAFTSMTDPLGRVRRFERDALERVSSETSPGGRIKRYRYLEQGGQLLSQTDGGGRHTEWQYDELKRVVKRRIWMDSLESDPDAVINYSYDDYGRLLSLVSGEENRKFAYDADGRIIGKMDGDAVLWEAGYDVEDSLIHLVGEMTEIGYARGQHGRLDGMTVPAAGGKVLENPWVISYGYDANGQVVHSETSDGWSKEYGYDACGRCVSLSVKQGEEDVYHVQYTFDKNGRRVSATEMDGDGEQKRFWTYDELGRLVEERVETADGKEIRDWTGDYDVAGNLLEEQWRTNGTHSATRTCQVDDDDCLVSVVDVSKDGRRETHYEWNGNGELVKAVTTGSKSETREWSWNADGRLAGVVIVTPSSRVEVTYEYDLEGILKRQVVHRREGGRDETVYREFRFETVSHGGMAMLLEMTEERDGVHTTRSFLHGHELEGWVENGQICHAWSDGTNGIRGITQEDVTTYFTTDAWGVGKTVHDGFGYAGEWQDDASGLVYLRGRFYWPEIRRFISADRHPANMANPQGWHRYAYCLNDPVNNRDPQGEFALTATMLMTMKLMACYACFAMITKGIYDTRHAEMMQNLVEMRKRYHENASVVVHGVVDHEVNWSEEFSDTLEKYSGNQDMYEFLWSGFQSGWLVLMIPNPISHTIASKSLVCFLSEIYMKGYTNINVIAHSWGTVLSRDAMNSSGLSFGLWATMGSPLGLTFPKFSYRKWMNFYSKADGVTWLTWLLLPMGYTDNMVQLYLQIKGVEQHETLSKNYITSHTSYWTDPTVLNFIGIVLKYQ